jgi:Zn-dependent protease with chaperone function
LRVVGLSLACFVVFSVLLYVFAGRALSANSGRRHARVARFCFLSYLAAAALTVLCVRSIFEPRLPRFILIILIYVIPLLWIWGAVVGASWLEVRAWGVRSGLWRFHRFNVLHGYLLFGQRVPYFSAAVAIPADITLGTGLIGGILLHLALATAIGWGVRWIVVSRLVNVRPFPDQRLAVELRTAARDAGIHLRGVLLVATEPGQFVNAVAATTSRFIFVAEGLWRGLDREEVRAVLLHEVGHLGQPILNGLQNLALLGWPILLWGLRAVGMASADLQTALLRSAGLLLAGIVGSRIMRFVSDWGERRADRFAEERAAPGALSGALIRLSGLLPGGTEDPALRNRLSVLEPARAKGSQS